MAADIDGTEKGDEAWHGRKKKFNNQISNSKEESRLKFQSGI
jgi:hypothetical protein